MGIGSKSQQRMCMKSIFTENRILRAMIYVNVFMFVISLIFSRSDIRWSLNPFLALAPSTNVLNFLGASGVLPISHFHSWGSLITANWLHGGLLHIVFNMLALCTIVPLVVDAYGVFRMFTIYTLAGAGGFFASYLGNIYMTIGASSGICGLIGALLLFGYLRGGVRGQMMVKQVSGWVLSLILLGLFVPNINNWGHAGGFLSGMLVGFLCGYNEKRKEHLFDRIISIGLMFFTFCLLIVPVFHGVQLIFG